MAIPVKKSENCTIDQVCLFSLIILSINLRHVPLIERVRVLDRENSILENPYSSNENVNGCSGPAGQPHAWNRDRRHLLHSETVNNVEDCLPDYAVHPEFEAWSEGFATLECGCLQA